MIDATDNFAAKFLINDACVLAGKPYIHAGVVGFAGQVMTVIPGEGPCYRCIFRDMPAAGEIPPAWGSRSWLVCSLWMP